MLAQRERGDNPRVLPLLEALLEVVLESRGALVALLGNLREQPEDNLRQHGGQRRPNLIGRRRLACHVAIDPAERVAGLEGQPAGEKLIEDNAE